MKVTILDRGRTISLAVQSTLVDNSIDLHFNSPTESLEAFHKLRELNIRCYHVGANAPKGPYVTIYRTENKDTVFSFQ